MKKYSKKIQGLDRIEGDKIVLYDKDLPGPRVLKKVEIISTNGEKRFYKIKKTIKGGYLFN